MKWRNLPITRIFLLSLIITVYTNANGQSVYTENVELPKFDSLDSEHVLIKSKSDWETVNDPSKRFFFISPHSGYGTIEINSSGTFDSRRYILLHNGNNEHPALLESDLQANVNMVFNNAHHWVVDRMSSIDSRDEACFIVKNRSSNILLNRLHLSGFKDGIQVRGSEYAPFTSNITIQNCRFERMSLAGIDSDRVAILLTGEYWNSDRTLLNTKILNNEIKNCNDGIMLIRHPEQGHAVNYQGTIIDNNHIYVDREVYTDGTGDHDPTGLWALTENGIDLKGGSEDPENPVLIINNYIWGFRKTDKNGGGSGSHGAAITGHYYVKNIAIRNNVIFSSNRGITFAGQAGLPYSVENAEVTGNILYDIGYEPSGVVEYGSFFYHGRNINFSNNTLVAVDKRSRWISVYGDEREMNISTNIIFNAYQQSGSRSPSTRIVENIFYITKPQQAGDGKHYTSESMAKREDLSFTTDRYTKQPRSITLHGVIITPAESKTVGIFPEHIDEGQTISSYPNPFRGETTIEYILDRTFHVTLKVYDIRGKEVCEILSKAQSEGKHTVHWVPVDCPPGIYFGELYTGKGRALFRMVLTE